MNKGKLILSMFVLLIVAASCQKEPDMDKLSSNFMVYTEYDKNADFSSFTTFYLPDTIKILGSTVTNWVGTTSAPDEGDPNADKIIAAVAVNLENRGYTRITDPEQRTTADIGIQLSYVEDTQYVTYYNTPYYWGDWWWGYNWGPGWGYVYPTYSITYSYQVGSLLGEMIYIDKAESKLAPVWSFCVTGSLSGFTNSDIARTVNGIYQAFTQSPYVQR